MIIVKYVSIFIRSTRIYPFPTELNAFYSHYEFISSAGCSAVQKNVLFIKQCSGKSCLCFKRKYWSSILEYSQMRNVERQTSMGYATGTSGNCRWSRDALLL